MSEYEIRLNEGEASAHLALQSAPLAITVANKEFCNRTERLMRPALLSGDVASPGCSGRMALLIGPDKGKFPSPRVTARVGHLDRICCA